MLDAAIARADASLAVERLSPTAGDKQQGVYRELSDALTSVLLV